MARFNVRLRTRSGVKSLSIVSKSKPDALRIAGNHGRVIGINRAVNWDFVPGMTVSERFELLRTLAMLMSSGRNIIKALEIIQSDFGGNIRKACRNLHQNISLGHDLPEAMEMDRKNFPLMTTAFVRAGWNTGDGWAAVNEAANYERLITNVSKNLMGKVYASIGNFILAGIMLFGTTRYGGPLVLDIPIFRDNPAVDVRWAVNLGNASEIAMILTATFFFVMIFLGTFARRVAPTTVDMLILRIPYFRELVFARVNQITFYRMARLLDAGTRLEPMLGLISQTMQQGALRTDIEAGAKAISKGRNWTEPMKSLRATDRAALSVAQDGSDISKTLNLMSEYYRDIYIERVNAVGPAIQGIAMIYLVTSGVVMFGQMMLPLLMFSSAAGSAGMH